MKPSYVLGIVLLAVITAMLISTMSAPSAYGNFTQAFASEGTEFTVIGHLSKGKTIHYNPKVNPNEVRFQMTDKEGVERTVVLNQAKPQDMERSEDIVIKGKATADVFSAHTILLKCPSKYEEQNTLTTNGAK
jgi:cytochrome c-type biogenesis protein CcmE